MYDVIVVGAGPAGSTVSRKCAEKDLETLVLDKQSFPREKLCGGAVSERTLKLLDFDIPEEVINQGCNGARVHFQGETVEVEKDYRLGLFVSREKFDSFLLKKAEKKGAEVKDGERVLNITDKGSHVLVKTDKEVYRSKIVVGADGVDSTVAREVLGEEISEEYFKLALENRVEEVKFQDKKCDGIIDVFFGDIDGGYGWVFPHRDFFSVGIGSYEDKMKKPLKRQESFLKNLNLDVPDDFRGHRLPVGGQGRKKVSGRTMLVGDAAGLVDPLTGEGIYYAIKSGKMCGETIGKAFSDEEPDLKELKHYEERCLHEIERKLKWSLKICRLLYRYPWFFMNVYVMNKEVLSRSVDVVSRGESNLRLGLWMFFKTPLFVLRCFFGD